LTYTPPFLLFNAHLETIYPALVRRVTLHAYERECITTPDDDFLDLDWLRQSSTKLVIISHGLEGNTERAYVKGMAKACYAEGYDILTWNYRGCGEEINRQLRFYHSGATEDLDTVIQHAVQSNRYTEINLIGFSLGGNLTLKYIGENHNVHGSLNKIIAFSVPLNLHTSCLQISRPENILYSQRFLKSLRKKVLQKASQHKVLDIGPLSKIKTLLDFDDYYTGPIHGFKNALDYYEQSSAIRYIDTIQYPTLIVNALNDPFLSPECYPHKQLAHHKYVQLEVPERGGHVGFTQFNKNGLYWSEQRALAFLQS
jgi:uncharacterized protein